jgi:hypothetical protein
MKTVAKFLLTLMPALVVFFSCHKEYSYEGNFVSVGYLIKDANNNCSGAIVAGLYVKSKKLNDSNFIQAQVHVTKSGNYRISTDTLNGFSFTASGSFRDTGTLQIKLVGNGKPIVAGTNLFTVNYSSSMCNIAVQVADSAHIAAYSLQGSPDACMSDTVLGSYIKGIALDTSEKIIVTLNVTSPGSYYISTNTVNGYNFSGSGTLTSAGIQTIVLSASGSPINPGTDVFKVTGGSSSCSFSNIVYTPVIVTANTDHFPLTASSYWNYDDLFNAGDTIGRAITDTITENGNVYEIMKEHFSAGDSNLYYRKQGADYYEYAEVDKYTNAFRYAPVIYADINFLKENLNTGDSWYSTQYSGTATFGQVILFQYYFVCRNANAAVVVNGKAFTNVYIIVMQPEVSAVGYTPGPTAEKYTFYYAKGIGLIYSEEANLYYTQPEMQIRNWVVH